MPSCTERERGAKTQSSCTDAVMSATCHHLFEEFLQSDLESAPRFVYKEPTEGTSLCDEAIAERGWKFVLPTNQQRAHFKLQRVYLRAFVQYSGLLKLCVMEQFSTLSFSILQHYPKINRKQARLMPEYPDQAQIYIYIQLHNVIS